MHDRPEFLRNVAADNEPPEAVFVPARYPVSEHHVKKISDGALRVQLRCFLDMEQIVVLRFRTVPGVPAPFHILNG